MTDSVMSSEEMKESLESLQKGLPIPGLEKEKVVDNYCETEFKDSLDECKTEEERAERKKKFVEHYITGPGKAFIDGVISSLKAAYYRAKTMIENLISSVADLVSLNIIPSVVTVGSATSTPNPAFTALDNRQKKEMILSIVESITEVLASVYTLAILIHFQLPSEVGLVTLSLATLQTAINAIPV